MATRSGVILSIVCGLVVTTAVGLGAWNLNETASVPKTYATKAEVKSDIAELKADAAKDRDEIRQEVSDKIEDISTEQRYIRDAVDDIKNILMNR